jgi:hypothetical protein
MIISVIWDMGNRDDRYKRIKPLIAGGEIKLFSDIFKHIPKTVVAKDLGKKNDRFKQLITKQLDGFTLKDLFLMASFCGIEETRMLDLVMKEYLANKDKIIKSDI